MFGGKAVGKVNRPFTMQYLHVWIYISLWIEALSFNYNELKEHQNP